MAKYMFQARKVDGKTVKGKIEANNENEVKNILRSNQMILQKIYLVNTKKTNIVEESKRSSGFNLGFGKVKEKDLQIFTRQFSTLINSGIPIVDSLKILSEGMRPGILKKASSNVLGGIESGQSLADSMNKYNNVFDRLYVNMVRAGESAGILDTILERLAIYIEKSVKIKRQVKAALTYPAVIVVVSMGIVIGLMVFIVPKFQDLFSGSGKELPALTQMVVTLSNSMQSNWIYILMVLIFTPIGLKIYFDTEAGKQHKDFILLNVPVFGELIQKSSIARFARTLSTLLTSGVNIVEALEIAAITSGNCIIEKTLLQSKVSIERGKTMVAPLKKSSYIPDMVCQMIGVGESSGTLDTMLEKIANFFEEEVEVVVNALSSLIEPILIVVLGAIIAFVVIAMYLPVFNMANIVG